MRALKPANERNTDRLQVPVSPTLREQVEAAARERNVTLSQFTRSALRLALDTQVELLPVSEEA
jgi:hypothetical protein